MSQQTGEELLALYRPDLCAELKDHPAFRKRQVLAHLMRPEAQPFAQATALPADLRARLETVGANTLTLVASRVSKDGTKKLLYTCRDGAHIETVVMPYRNRTTACISSQVGCPVGCHFCATGADGLRRNLTAAEIVDQVRGAAAVSAESGARLSNIVYMGMGEPLLNLQAVLASIKVLTDPLGMAIGHRSLAVSTVGIPSGIIRLGQAEPQVNLALSLHAATDKVRESLIPATHRHPLKDVLEAAWAHFEATRRKLMVEYVLLSGVNDSLEDARRLAALLRGHVVTVNLLSWNPVDDLVGKTTVRAKPGAGAGGGPRGMDRRSFATSPRETMMAFCDTLRTRGIEVTVRQSKGADIRGACGQLAGRKRTYTEGASDTEVS